MAERSHDDQHSESSQDDEASDNSRQRRYDRFVRSRNNLRPKTSTSNSTPPKGEPQSPSRDQSILARVRSVANAARQRRTTESPVGTQPKSQPSSPERTTKPRNEAEIRKQLEELQRELAAATNPVPDERNQMPSTDSPSISENQPKSPAEPRRQHTPTATEEQRSGNDADSPRSEAESPEIQQDAAVNSENLDRTKQPPTKVSRKGDSPRNEQPHYHTNRRIPSRGKARAPRADQRSGSRHAGEHAGGHARPTHPA